MSSVGSRTSPALARSGWECTQLTLGRCYLPALQVSIYSMHRSPRHWQDPLAFKPERFMPGTPEAEEVGWGRGGLGAAARRERHVLVTRLLRRSRGFQTRAWEPARPPHHASQAKAASGAVCKRGGPYSAHATCAPPRLPHASPRLLALADACRPTGPPSSPLALAAASAWARALPRWRPSSPWSACTSRRGSTLCTPPDVLALHVRCNPCSPACRLHRLHAAVDGGTPER